MDQYMVDQILLVVKNIFKEDIFSLNERQKLVEKLNHTTH